MGKRILHLLSQLCASASTSHCKGTKSSLEQMPQAVGLAGVAGQDRRERLHEDPPRVRRAIAEGTAVLYGEMDWPLSPR
jgi:hypothetical protein